MGFGRCRHGRRLSGGAVIVAEAVGAVVAVGGALVMVVGLVASLVVDHDAARH